MVARMVAGRRWKRAFGIRALRPGRARLTAIMLALALALADAAIAAAEDTLLLHTVHPTDSNAVCNDGSAP